MSSFKDYLQKLSESTGIKFSLLGEEGTIYFGTKKFSHLIDKVEFEVTLGKKKAFLITEKKYEMKISILKYSIENKYKEMFLIREQFFINVLENKEISKEDLLRYIPFLNKGCTLFIVKVDGSRYEAQNIIKIIYSEQEVITALYKDNIVVIGNLSEAEQQANNIKESVISKLYCKCYVSYIESIYNCEDIKEGYNHSFESLILGIKYGIKGGIFNYNNMLFEKVVYNIDEKVKNQLLENFKDKFYSFDSETINTIEEFISSDLNISVTSKKLYIHRNTLIYRLDKIYKETGYDLRNFKEASIFYITLLLWKENK